jgi:hypothetical protein
MPMYGSRQLTCQLPASLEARGCFVGERCPVQHPGIVDQRRQGAEPVDDLGHRGVPPIYRRDVKRNRHDAVVAERVHSYLQVVGQQIASSDPKSVLVQSLHDRRTLAARGAGHQRNAIR